MAARIFLRSENSGVTSSCEKWKERKDVRMLAGELYNCMWVLWLWLKITIHVEGKTRFVVKLKGNQKAVKWSNESTFSKL